MSQTWGPDIARRVAAQIRELRGERSGQWLSDRTAELGHRVSRTTVSELENGKRSTVALDAVIVLAAALDVSVGTLLYPPDGPLEVEALPGKFVARNLALESLGGSVADIRKAQTELDDAVASARASMATVSRLLGKIDSPDGRRDNDLEKNVADLVVSTTGGIAEMFLTDVPNSPADLKGADKHGR